MHLETNLSIAPQSGTSGSFNPHFARMHLETYFLLSAQIIKHVIFQSSFCEDAPWNPQIDVWLKSCNMTFNPHFARMHLETAMNRKDDARDRTFNPHFARMHLETTTRYIILNRFIIFQSSFCEDAPWNHFQSSVVIMLARLSILILRGCTLKLCQYVIFVAVDIIFQSSFCEDAPWNMKECGQALHEINPFNPHFARMHLETLCFHWRIGGFIFQSSFCEDAPWNNTIVLYSDGTIYLSILILRGCTLKLGIWMGVGILVITFQSSFCEDAPWNPIWAR